MMAQTHAALWRRQRARLANTAKAGDLSVAVVGMGLIGGSFQKAATSARRWTAETLAP